LHDSGALVIASRDRENAKSAPVDGSGTSVQLPGTLSLLARLYPSRKSVAWSIWSMGPW